MFDEIKKRLKQDTWVMEPEVEAEREQKVSVLAWIYKAESDNSQTTSYSQNSLTKTAKTVYKSHAIFCDTPCFYRVVDCEFFGLYWMPIQPESLAEAKKEIMREFAIKLTRNKKLKD